MVNLAWKMVWHDKVRFLITVSGVGFAVALVFVQVGLFLGVLRNASVTIEQASADLWITARNAPNVDLASTFPETYVQRVRSIPGVTRADNLIVWVVRVAQPNGATEDAVVYALEDFSRWGLPWSVEEGDPADLRRGKFVMIDESAHKRFGALAVGDYREFYGQRLKVIGRTSGALSFTTMPIAFVDYRVVQSMMRQELQGRATYILVKLDRGADLERVRAEMRRRLPHNDIWTRDEWAARSRAYWTDTTGLGLNMVMTVVLGAVVGVIVVAQTLYTSTVEHLSEFAIVKAIGGSNADVLAVIAKQAVLAALIGYALGATLAHAARPIVAALDLKLEVSPAFTALVFLGTVGLCLAASTVSFRRVATLDPAMVFRG
jgi:putative ABC transport system permease protein